MLHILQGFFLAMQGKFALVMKKAPQFTRGRPKAKSLQFRRCWGPDNSSKFHSRIAMLTKVSDIPQEIVRFFKCHKHWLCLTHPRLCWKTLSIPQGWFLFHPADPWGVGYMERLTVSGAKVCSMQPQPILPNCYPCIDSETTTSE